VSAAGCCLFSAQTFVPDILFKLGPHHWVTRLAGKIFGLAGPVIRLLLAAGPLLRLNSLYILPHAQALRLCTGMPIFTGSFLRIGERSYNLERLFSAREGLTGKDDSLPARLTHTPQDPANPKTVVPLEKMLPLYYKTRGWKDGFPTKRRLKKLGIEVD
ncbi:MAG: aldehyde ferredoxin oxidoreductase C-terminal domain-containing protein, partial [Oscillospiraceae bacterium]|nr:aldehyde ferredoxin oxidoreductase C-terminal domain-containing protein [Oscillospiraceae bacterium]